MLEVHATALVTFLEHEPYRCISSLTEKELTLIPFTGNCMA